jgi:hypothetical protein
VNIINDLSLLKSRGKKTGRKREIGRTMRQLNPSWVWTAISWTAISIGVVLALVVLHH